MSLFTVGAVVLSALTGGFGGCATKAEPQGSSPRHQVVLASVSADGAPSKDGAPDSAADTPGIVSVSATGGGCSDSYTFVDVRECGDSANVWHHAFEEARVDEHTSVATTDCQLTVRLRDTGRHRYRVRSHRDAIVIIEKGQTAQIIEQALVEHGSTAGTERTSEIVGPYDGMHELILEAETACGAVQTVHFGAAIRLDGGETRQEGMVSLGLDDAAIEVYARIQVTAIPCP